MDPTQEDLNALGKRFFAGLTDHGRPLSWADMSEVEQAQSLAEWRRDNATATTTKEQSRTAFVGRLGSLTSASLQQSSNCRN